MSKSLFLFENSISRVSFTETRGLDLSYIMMVNLSSFWKFSGDSQLLEGMSRDVLQGRCYSHARHAVFFPMPQNCEVELHPVNAWKTGRARDLASPRVEQMLLMLIIEKWRPMPNATHTLARWL